MKGKVPSKFFLPNRLALHLREGRDGRGTSAESQMTSFFSRRGGGTGVRSPAVSIRVGHVYVDARRRTLYCLNETARQMIHEGVPLTHADFEGRSLRTLEGEPVQTADLPLLRAWRERAPREASYLFTSPDGTIRHLTWSAAPLVG